MKNSRFNTYGYKSFYQYDWVAKAWVWAGYIRKRPERQYRPRV